MSRIISESCYLRRSVNLGNSNEFPSHRKISLVCRLSLPLYSIILWGAYPFVAHSVGNRHLHRSFICISPMTTGDTTSIKLTWTHSLKIATFSNKSLWSRSNESLGSYTVCTFTRTHFSRRQCWQIPILGLDPLHLFPPSSSLPFETPPLTPAVGSQRICSDSRRSVSRRYKYIESCPIIMSPKRPHWLNSTETHHPATKWSQQRKRISIK